MTYNLTREQLEEMVICIVQCHLDEDEAMEYALSVCGEFTFSDAVVWPDEPNDNMAFTHLTDKAVKAGVYDS
jgi:hypothetical protein